MKISRIYVGFILLFFLLVNVSAEVKVNYEFLELPAIDVFPNHDDTASGKIPLNEFIADGKKLFRTVFNTGDGVGRPESTGNSKPSLRPRLSATFQRIAGPDASSCVDCHNQPIQGGSGGLATNVFVGAHNTDPPVNHISVEVTSERNTTTLFGTGAIEMLAYEMTEELQAIRKQSLIIAEEKNKNIKASLIAKGVDFGYIIAHPDGTYDASGIRGIDMDLVVKPFGVKGIAVSLREFTNFALNHHHGIQTSERFGWARTGIVDFDNDGFSNEFSIGQTSALVVYQASLPPPVRIIYTDPEKQKSSELGEKLFRQIGCASCHIPKLPLRNAWFLEPNPYNRPGSAIPRDMVGQIALPLEVYVATDKNYSGGVYRDDDGQVFVAAYTDLKRHVICDDDDLFFCNEKIEQDFVPTNQFLTTKLWDAGTSAPYGHQGHLTTLEEAIIHHSGEAKNSKNEFVKLPKPKRLAIIHFLKSLQVVADD